MLVGLGGGRPGGALVTEEEGFGVAVDGGSFAGGCSYAGGRP
jgi:hypothetical protein